MKNCDAKIKTYWGKKGLEKIYLDHRKTTFAKLFCLFVFLQYDEHFLSDRFFDNLTRIFYLLIAQTDKNKSAEKVKIEKRSLNMAKWGEQICLVIVNKSVGVAFQFTKLINRTDESQSCRAKFQVNFF